MNIPVVQEQKERPSIATVEHVDNSAVLFGRYRLPHRGSLPPNRDGVIIVVVPSLVETKFGSQIGSRHNCQSLIAELLQTLGTENRVFSNALLAFEDAMYLRIEACEHRNMGW